MLQKLLECENQCYTLLVPTGTDLFATDIII